MARSCAAEFDQLPEDGNMYSVVVTGSKSGRRYKISASPVRPAYANLGGIGRCGANTGLDELENNQDQDSKRGVFNRCVTCLRDTMVEPEPKP